jgi:hypothetical protein
MCASQPTLSSPVQIANNSFLARPVKCILPKAKNLPKASHLIKHKLSFCIMTLKPKHPTQRSFNFFENHLRLKTPFFSVNFG